MIPTANIVSSTVTGKASALELPTTAAGRENINRPCADLKSMSLSGRLPPTGPIVHFV